MTEQDNYIARALRECRGTISASLSMLAFQQLYSLERAKERLDKLKGAESISTIDPLSQLALRLLPWYSVHRNGDMLHVTHPRKSSDTIWAELEDKGLKSGLPPMYIGTEWFSDALLISFERDES